MVIPATEALKEKYNRLKNAKVTTSEKNDPVVRANTIWKSIEEQSNVFESKRSVRRDLSPAYAVRMLELAEQTVPREICHWEEVAEM
ncbi:hypothetical protein PsorP6_005806 [Peronosclerospora sorghi]|uniref:Uncharacterized protein n=1 Tax=Peronosclerospora sorghi TaxID=230839 RepID=A0ACC0W3B1_9STRA|nr:hypothetical protein PsorP6_005806 [Peronosclerospora sorghi]